MSHKLDVLLNSAREHPLKLLEVTAYFLEAAASSNKEEIIHNQKKISLVITAFADELPMAKPLMFLIKGVSNFYLTNFKEAKKNLLEALSVFKTGMPLSILGATHMILGANYRSLGEIDLAVEHQFKAAELLHEDGLFRITYAYTYYQLGEIHISIGEYDSAETYYQKALSIVSSLKDTTANFRMNNGLGNCYLHLKKYNKSLIYLNKALSIKGISAAEKSRGLCDLGVVNYYQGNTDQAVKYLQESLAIRQENHLQDAASTSLVHLGQALILQNKDKKAITLLKDALKIAHQYNALSKKIKIYNLLAKAYDNVGDTKQALKYFKLYDALNNEVRSEQEHKIFRLKNKQIEHQRQQLQEKNIQLKDTLDELAKVKNSRKSLFFSIATAIVLVLLTEAFLDPLIESYAHSVYLSLGVKIIIALLLKPMESLYERILFRKAMKLK